MADLVPCQIMGGKSAIEKPKRKRKQPFESEQLSEIKKPQVCEAADIKQASDSQRKLQLGNEKHNLNVENGTSYKAKLACLTKLINVKKANNADNKFSYKNTMDDPTTEIFNDIVISFNEGGQTGAVKIRVNPSSDSPTRKIKLNDFISTQDRMKPLALPNIFTSFYDQSPQMSGLERLVICTKLAIDDDTRDLWKPLDLASMSDSTSSLDAYVGTLFAYMGGRCYQLDYDCLTDGTFNELYQSLRQYSKRTRLAKLLVNAVKREKDRLIRDNFLVKEYYHAIISIIDTSDYDEKGSYRFNNEFLQSSITNPPPGYKDFRLEFEEEYSQMINVWEDLKNKRLHVEENFLLKLDEWQNNDSDISFPRDDIDQHLRAFCETLILVCDTKGEIELDETIATLQKNLYADGKGTIEEDVMDSMDVGRVHPNDGNTSVSTNLKTVSDQLRTEIAASPIRISSDAIKASDLYRRMSCESLLELDVYDVHFGAAVLTDIIRLQNEDRYDILFITTSDFRKDFEEVKRLLRSNEYCNYLIIFCNEMLSATHEIVREWNDGFLKNSSKKVFLVRKTNSTPTDLSCFHICDIATESWKQWLLGRNIPLCATTISPSKLFQTTFQQISIEKLIRLLDWGKQTEVNNRIVEKYRQIENNYVHRHWINQGCPGNNLTAEHLESFDHDKMEIIIEEIQGAQEEEISFMKITEHIKGHPQFKIIFQEANNPRCEQEHVIGNEAGKVLILLGEAGYGKSTYFTWLASHLWNKNRSSLIVECNLYDHSTEFAKTANGEMSINGIEILRMLYKLFHLSLEERSDIDFVSECLTFSNGTVDLNTEIFSKQTLENQIQLMIFKEKFNARELMLLFDGFDKIEPIYKEETLKCLSLFARLDGVSKLYVTIRPYIWKNKFEKAFEKPTFYLLNPLSLHDKGAMIYKILKEKWRNRNVDDAQTSDFCKALCVTHLHSLKELIDNALLLMVSTGIFVSLANRYIYFQSKSLNLELFTESKRIFNPTFIVEEFVNRMIRRHHDDKIRGNSIEETKQKHTLTFVALLVVLDEKVVHDILSPEEINEAMSYMNEIMKNGEKTGIINEIVFENQSNPFPSFIHRTFSEVLAASWIRNHEMRVRKGERLSISVGLKHLSLQRAKDAILPKSYPNVKKIRKG